MKTLNDRIHSALSEEWCGNKDHPPGSTQKIYVLEGVKSQEISGEVAHRDHHTLPGCVYVFSGLNDGFEVGIGFLDQWHCMLRRPTALRLAWFILWTWWAKGQWFGLKRVIWYGTLRRMLARWEQMRRLS